MRRLLAGSIIVAVVIWAGFQSVPARRGAGDQQAQPVRERAGHGQSRDRRPDLHLLPRAAQQRTQCAPVEPAHAGQQLHPVHQFHREGQRRPAHRRLAAVPELPRRHDCARRRAQSRDADRDGRRRDDDAHRFGELAGNRPVRRPSGVDRLLFDARGGARRTGGPGDADRAGAARRHRAAAVHRLPRSARRHQRQVPGDVQPGLGAVPDLPREELLEPERPSHCRPRPGTAPAPTRGRTPAARRLPQTPARTATGRTPPAARNGC